MDNFITNWSKEKKQLREQKNNSKNSHESWGKTGAINVKKRDRHSWKSLIAFEIRQHKNPALNVTTQQTVF